MMRINPDIAALQGDRAPQRRAQAAMDAACRAWRSDDRVARALDALHAYGDGAALEECPQLQRIFTVAGEAESLVGKLSDRMCRAMRREPFGHPPFRHGYDGSASTLLLAKSGPAQLMLQAREPGSSTMQHAIFSDAERHDAVLAGKARCQIHEVVGRPGDTARFVSRSVVLTPGTRMAQDLSRECLRVTDVERRLVTLRLLRTSADPAPTREYSLPDGRLVHLSAGDLATSHRESMIALLGRMCRRDAAPVLARMARGRGDGSLRWQALRECLALDTAEGFAALRTIARDAADPLCGQAGALRARLIEAHPQLLEWEKSACPA